MHMLTYAVVLILSYILGSIPFGLIIVKIKTGKDLRTVASGRTGGTNAMRAGGPWAFAGTAVFDVLKGAGAVWLASALVPGTVWLKVFAPMMAILGHNYSIFLTERDERGRLRLRGGAGGAPTVGGAAGIWLPSLLIVLPVAGILLFIVGYASVTTMGMALIITAIFAVRAWLLGQPWQFVIYGLIAEALLVWTLRPNIKRLIEGKERVVGLRARKKKPTTKPPVQTTSGSGKPYSSSSSSSS
jgi:acyl phosphate:glycerol-3-phosphate acyltransferase